MTKEMDLLTETDHCHHQVELVALSWPPSPHYCHYQVNRRNCHDPGNGPADWNRPLSSSAGTCGIAITPLAPTPEKLATIVPIRWNRWHCHDPGNGPAERNRPVSFIIRWHWWHCHDPGNGPANRNRPQSSSGGSGGIVMIQEMDPPTETDHTLHQVELVALSWPRKWTRQQKQTTVIIRWIWWHCHDPGNGPANRNRPHTASSGAGGIVMTQEMDLPTETDHSHHQVDLVALSWSRKWTRQQKQTTHCIKWSWWHCHDPGNGPANRNRAVIRWNWKHCHDPPPLTKTDHYCHSQVELVAVSWARKWTHQKKQTSHCQVDLVTLPDLHRSVFSLNFQSICTKYHTKVPCLQSTKVIFFEKKKTLKHDLHTLGNSLYLQGT